MILILNHQTVSLIPQVPPGYKNYHLHGSHATAWSGKACTLFLQQVSVADSNLSYLLCSVTKKTKLEMIIPETGNHLLIGLGGNWINRVGTQEQLYLGPNQYNFLYRSALHLSCTPEPGSLCMVLWVSYPPVMVQQILQLYTQAQQMATVSLQKEGSGMFPQSPLADAGIMSRVTQLLQTSYYPEPRHFHRQWLSHLLQAVCKRASVNSPQCNLFEPATTEALHAARSWIDQDPGRHLRVTEIATHCALNREKLRQGFKTLYGATVYAYMLHCRLALAQQLLEETRKPIKEIAKLTGYRNTSNFCTAYKKYYGITPSAIRRAGGGGVNG